MAKAKQKKMLAMALAASVAMSAMPVAVFAEETEGNVLGGETVSENGNTKAEVTVTNKTEIKNENGSTTTKTDADLSNGAMVTIEVTVKEDKKTDTDRNKETITDTTTKNWSGEITNGNQDLIGKDSFIENKGETEENNGTADGTTKPSFSTDPTGKGDDVDVNGNEKTDDAMDDLVNNFKGQNGTKEDKTLVSEGEKTSLSGSEEKSDTDVEKNGQLKEEYGQLSGKNESTTTTVKKEQYSETVSNNSEETKPTLSDADKGTPEEESSKFEQVGETTKKDDTDYPAPNVEYGKEMDLTATVTPTDTKDTEKEYLKDWTTLYNAQVENVKKQVLTKAEAEAKNVTAANGTALEMKQDTSAEKVAGSEETYVYTGTDTDGTKVVKTVYVVKEVETTTGNVTFTTHIEEVRTPNYVLKSDNFDENNPGTPATSNTTYTFDAGDTVTKEETILPTRPTEGKSFTMTESGETATTTKVEEITDADGKVVGYKRYFVVKDAEGRELKSGSEEIRATQKTTTETVKKTETTDKTYTETITEERTVTKTSSTETVTMDVANVYRELVLTWLSAAAGGTGNDMDGAIEDWNSLVPDLEKYNDMKVSDKDVGKIEQEKDPNAAQLKYLEHILHGGLHINTKDNGSTSAYMYKLIKDSLTAYGYCVDFAVHAQKGYYYEITNLDDHNDSYYQGEKAEALEKIANISLNGFWGTTSGTGSLENVKSVLQNYLQSQKRMSDKDAEDFANKLDGKEALTATQIAIWQYGNSSQSGTSGVNMNDILRGYTEEKEERVKYLIEALTNSTATNNATNILDEKDIESATVIVGDKVANAKENTDDDPDNDVFNTSVKFKLAVIPTENDDLVVYVYNGKDAQPVATKKITAKNRNTDGTYSIDDIALQENATINLKLSGTQFLKNGVYIYSSEYINGTPSQSFVTVAEGKRKVNLDVAMTFNVTDPQNGSISGKKETAHFSRNDKKTTENIWREQEQIVTALVEVTTETITTSSSEWGDEYNREYKKNSEKEEEKKEEEKKEEEKKEDEKKEESKEEDKKDEGIIAGDSEDIDEGVLAGDSEETEEIIAPAGMVLAAKTNDAAAPWAAAGSFSLLGLLGTLLFGRRKNANR